MAGRWCLDIARRVRCCACCLDYSHKVGKAKAARCRLYTGALPDSK